MRRTISLPVIWVILDKTNCILNLYSVEGFALSMSKFFWYACLFFHKAKHGCIYILLYCNCIRTAKCIRTSLWHFFCNFKTKISATSWFLPCDLSIPALSVWHRFSLIGLFYLFRFTRDMPWNGDWLIKAADDIAQRKCVVPHTLSHPFLTLETVSPCLLLLLLLFSYVGVCNIFILDVHLARCLFSFFFF